MTRISSNNWVWQERFSLKPHCKLSRMLFTKVCFIILLISTCSNTLQAMHVKENLASNLQRQIFYPFLKTGGTHADFQSSGILSRLVRSLVDWCEYWCNSYCCGTLFQSLWSNAIRTSCFVDLLFFVIISEHPLLIQYSSKVMYLVAGHRVWGP